MGPHFVELGSQLWGLILSPRRPTSGYLTRSSNDPEPYLLTKGHGLHNLSLCRTCQKLSVRRMCAPEGCLYLENLWSLLKTQWKCRFCAFIAQTIRGTSTGSWESQLVWRDVVPPYKYTVYLSLANGRLSVNLGEHCRVADIELYCDPGMKRKLGCRAELSANNGYRRPTC